MSSQTDFPALSRPAFFDGQRLTAADLAAVQSFHRGLRWLHNSSLHNWGIAFGYVVTGSRGERTVTVQPGFALDCKGRELYLNETQEMPIPAVAGVSGGGPATYFLTVSYAEDEDLTPETRAGTCGTAGAVRRPEEPILRWQDPNDRSPDSGFRHGLDIVLATIEVQNCQLTKDISAVERRDAVPAPQPYVAAGQTTAGTTPWQLWPDPDPEQDGFAVGVVTTVSTHTAGFGDTPRYYAHVIGTHTFERAAEGIEQAAGIEEVEREPVMLTHVVDGYAQVANATLTSFDLRVILPFGFFFSGGEQRGFPLLNPPEVLDPASDFRFLLETELRWYVVWMGIEG